MPATRCFDAAPIGERAGEGEEHEIAAGHERGRQPARADLDRDLAGERGLGNRGERIELDARDPRRGASPTPAAGRDAFAHALAAPRARRDGAARSRSRWSRRARSARAPRPGRRSNPARRKTGRARPRDPLSSQFITRVTSEWWTAHNSSNSPRAVRRSLFATRCCSLASRARSRACAQASPARTPRNSGDL